MINNKIGVATSIFAEKSFDPFATIEYCKSNEISVIQHYLDPGTQNNSELIEKIASSSSDNNLQVVCHLHYSIDSPLLDYDYLSQVSKIFPNQDQKLVVIHFNEKGNIETALKAIKLVNSFGLTVALENFYIDKTEASLPINSKNYIELLYQASVQNLNIIPLIDFPRLFIDNFSHLNPLEKTEELLRELSGFYSDIALHLIDFNNNRQAREDWVPIGTGQMPYKEIFKMLNQYDYTINTAIIEFEKVDLANDSLNNLSALM
jgi:sugar phosphate isomerase/epimerase